jgi:hypothetical protein
MGESVAKLTSQKIAQLTKNRKPNVTIFIKSKEAVTEPFIPNCNTILSNGPIYDTNKFDKLIGTGHHAFFFNGPYTGFGQDIVSLIYSVKIDEKGSFQYYHTFTDVIKYSAQFLLPPNTEYYVANIEGLTGEYTGKNGFGVIKTNKTSTILKLDVYFNN